MGGKISNQVQNIYIVKEKKAKTKLNSIFLLYDTINYNHIIFEVKSVCFKTVFCYFAAFLLFICPIKNRSTNSPPFLYSVPFSVVMWSVCQHRRQHVPCL